MEIGSGTIAFFVSGRVGCGVVHRLNDRLRCLKQGTQDFDTLALACSERFLQLEIYAVQTHARYKVFN